MFTDTKLVYWTPGMAIDTKNKDQHIFVNIGDYDVFQEEVGQFLPTKKYKDVGTVAGVYDRKQFMEDNGPLITYYNPNTENRQKGEQKLKKSLEQETKVFDKPWDTPIKKGNLWSRIKRFPDKFLFEMTTGQKYYKD